MSSVTVFSEDSCSENSSVLNGIDIEVIDPLSNIPLEDGQLEKHHTNNNEDDSSDVEMIAIDPLEHERDRETETVQDIASSKEGFLNISSKKEQMNNEAQPKLKLTTRKRIDEKTDNSATSTRRNSKALITIPTQLLVATKSKHKSVIETANPKFKDCISFNCAVCKKRFGKIELWRSHITTSHAFWDRSNLQMKPTADGKMQCRQCKVVLMADLKLMRDHKLCHTATKCFRCKICGREAHTEDVILKHVILNHFKTGSYKCPLCSAIFKTGYQHYIHWRAELSLMGKRKLYFTTATDMAVSDSSPSTDKQENPPDTSPIGKKSKGNASNLGSTIPQFKECISFACPKCNHEFNTYKHWILHIIQAHDFCHDDTFDIWLPNNVMLLLERMDVLYFGSFVCKICKKDAKTDSEIIAHVSSNHFRPGNFKCPQCPVFGNTEYACYVHFRDSHKGDNETKAFGSWQLKGPFLVEKADEAMVPENNLLRDTNDLQFFVDESGVTKKIATDSLDTTLPQIRECIELVCPSCSQCFTSYAALCSHIREIHPLWTKFDLKLDTFPDGKAQCDQCGFVAYTDTLAEEKHILHHMLYKCLICKMCDTRFHSADQVIHHVAVNYFRTGQYFCPVCSESYMTRYASFAHWRNRHGSQGFQFMVINNNAIIKFKPIPGENSSTRVAPEVESETTSLLEIAGSCGAIQIINDVNNEEQNHTISCPEDAPVAFSTMSTSRHEELQQNSNAKILDIVKEEPILYQEELNFHRSKDRPLKKPFEEEANCPAQIKKETDIELKKLLGININRDKSQSAANSTNSKCGTEDMIKALKTPNFTTYFLGNMDCSSSPKPTYIPNFESPGLGSDAKLAAEEKLESRTIHKPIIKLKPKGCTKTIYTQKERLTNLFSDADEAQTQRQPTVSVRENSTGDLLMSVDAQRPFETTIKRTSSCNENQLLASQHSDPTIDPHQLSDFDNKSLWEDFEAGNIEDQDEFISCK